MDILGRITSTVALSWKYVIFPVPNAISLDSMDKLKRSSRGSESDSHFLTLDVQTCAEILQDLLVLLRARSLAIWD